MATSPQYFENSVEFDDGTTYYPAYGQNLPYQQYSGGSNIAISDPRQDQAAYVTGQGMWSAQSVPQQYIADGGYVHPSQAAYGNVMDIDPANDGYGMRRDLTTHSSSTPETRSSTGTTRSNGNSSNRNNSSASSAPSKAGSSSSSNRKSSKKAKTKEQDAAAQEETKRNRFLERNRIAASKCRQKKKEWMSDLEDQKTGLETTNNRLQVEYSSLQNRASHLKNQLMEHANCQDPNINKWIENEARKFVQGTSDRYNQMYSQYDRMSGPPSVLGSGHRDSVYSITSPNEFASSVISPTDNSTMSHHGYFDGRDEADDED